MKDAARLAVAGVTDITSLLIGFATPPTVSVNLLVGVREIASYDTSRIDVV